MPTPEPPVPARPAAAGSRRERHVADRRATILAAALGLFSRHGLRGTTIDQVAAAAEVSKTNLFYHFPTKEALYVAVLRDLLAVWFEPLRALSADQPPREALGAYVRAKLALSRDRPEASRLFCLEVVQGAPLLRDALAGELRGLVERKADVIRQWVDAGRLAPVDPHQLVFSLWALTQHHADFAAQVHALTGRSLADPAYFEQTVQHVCRLVLDGVAPAPAAAA